MHTTVYWAIRKYLWFWARIVLALRKPIIVGITGSVGKTTTKEMVAAVLSVPEVGEKWGMTWKTHENHNDNIGVPLSVLGETYFPTVSLKGLRFFLSVPFRAISLGIWKPYPRILVLEFGAGAMGNVRYNAQRARPMIGIITNVGPAHLEVFGDEMGVARAKGALIERVPKEGLVILGSENPRLAELIERSSAQVEVVDGEGEQISFHIARLVGRWFGVRSETMEKALQDARAVPGRFHTENLTGILLIDDSFNANPISMRRGLRRLAAIQKPGRRRVAVLGWMGELGTDAERFHREIAPFAREAAELVVGIGELARLYEPDVWFPSSAECAKSLGNIIRIGDIVFVKGSHSVELHEVTRELKRLYADSPP